VYRIVGLAESPRTDARAIRSPGKEPAALMQLMGHADILTTLLTSGSVCR